MPANKTIIMDCDGVLLDTFKSVPVYIKEKFPEMEGLYEPDKYLNHWEYFKDKQDQVIDLIIEWQKTPYFANIPPMQGAVEAVQKLKAAGYDIVIVTSAGTLDIAYEHRLQNLNKVFGPHTFKDLIFVDWHISKNKVLKDFAPTFFIEDSVKNAINSQELGHTPIIIEIPANQMYIQKHKSELTNIKICQSWPEICEYILR